MLGEGATDDINDSIFGVKRKFSINFSKAKTNFCLSVHCKHDNSCLFVNGKKSISLKQTIQMSIFQLNFALGVYIIHLMLLSLEKYI